MSTVKCAPNCCGTSAASRFRIGTALLSCLWALCLTETAGAQPPTILFPHVSDYMRGLLDDADEATLKASINLEPGTDVQVYDADLTTWAGITPAASWQDILDGVVTTASNLTTILTQLGLGTGDSPQFTAVNIGAATDTTITRTGAGQIDVEGSGVVLDSDIGSTVQKQHMIDVTAAPYNATGDGVTDDTAAVQAAIDGASVAGGGTVFVPHGRYKLTTVTAYGASWSAALTAKDNVTILGDANAVFVEDKTVGTDALGYAAIIVPDDVNDFTVDGITFEGSDANAVKGLGSAVLIRIEDGNTPAERITIRNCKMDHLRSYPIYWYSPDTNCEDVVIGLTVENNRVTNSGNHGISGRHARDVRVRGNYVEKTNLNDNTYGIDISSDNNDVTVEHNILRNCARGIKVEAADGLSERVVVAHNILIGGADTMGVGIRLVGAAMTVSDNVVQGHQGVGIKISSGNDDSQNVGINGTTVTGNIVRSIAASTEDGDGEGVIIERAGSLTYAGVVFSGNTISGTADAGLVVMMSRCVITDNKIYNFPTDCNGIEINGRDMDTTVTPDNCIVANNHIWRTASTYSIFSTSGKTVNGVQYRPLSLQVTGNYFYGGEVDVNDCNDLIFSANRVMGAVTFTDCNGIAVQGNSVYVRSNFNAQAAITFTSCDYLNVSGNLTDTLDYGTYAVEATGTVTQGYVSGHTDIGAGGFSLDANILPSPFPAGIAVKNGATTAGYADFYEDSTNGTNYIRLIGPASTDTDTLILPTAAEIAEAGYLYTDAAGVITTETPAGAGDFLADGSVPMTAPLFINEVAADSADQAGKGQIWVKNTTPNELWFTDDAGTAVQLGAAVAGDITSVWTDVTGDVGALTAAAGDTLDATSADSTVPWVVNAAAAPTVEGQAIWESDADTLRVGDGVATLSFAMTRDKLSVFAATTSAELYGVLSNETGSAAGSPLAVFNVNPTLTGATLAGILADNDDMVFEIDADSDGTNKYSFTDGASAEVASITEAGVLYTKSNIELGHATDTTISRSAAGAVQIEGLQVLLSGHTLTGEVTATMDTDGSTALTIADTVTVTGWTLGASAATTAAAADNDTSLATTAWCETTQAYLQAADVPGLETNAAVDSEAEIEAITGAYFGASKVVTAGYLWVADGTDFESVPMTGDVSIATGGATAVANDSHDHSAAGSTVTINAADITDLNAGTALTADLEEEVTEGSLADSTVVSADIKDGVVAAADCAANMKLSAVNFIIDGGGSEITDGIKGDICIPFGCTITGIAVLGDQAGAIVIDLWQGSIAEQIAGTIVDADSITAADPPTVAAAIGVDDDTLTDWDTSVTALQVLRVNVDSCTTITRVTLVLKLTKT